MTGCLLQAPRAIHFVLSTGQKGCLLQVPTIRLALPRGQKSCLLQVPTIHLAFQEVRKVALLQVLHAIHFVLYRGQKGCLTASSCHSLSLV